MRLEQFCQALNVRKQKTLIFQAFDGSRSLILLLPSLSHLKNMMVSTNIGMRSRCKRLHPFYWQLVYWTCWISNKLFEILTSLFWDTRTRRYNDFAWPQMNSMPSPASSAWNFGVKRTWIRAFGNDVTKQILEVALPWYWIFFPSKVYLSNNCGSSSPLSHSIWSRPLLDMPSQPGHGRQS